MDYPKSDPSVGLINGKFSDGNPSAGVPASRDPATHMNAVSVLGIGLLKRRLRASRTAIKPASKRPYSGRRILGESP